MIAAALLVSLLGLPDAEPAGRVRILCYNVHHGRGTDDKVDLARIAAVITKLKPDLVALQEVDRNTRRTQLVDQTAELARLTGLHGRFVLARPYDGGEYGQAVLSRSPVGVVTVHPLPNKPGAEGRIAGAVVVPATASSPEFLFVTTHLQHDDAATRARQSAELDRLFARHPLPVVVAGDLNAPRDSDDLKPLAANWRFATDKRHLTYPSAEPVKGIDHVLFRPAGALRVVKVEVVAERIASDHRPVLVVAEWVTPEPGEPSKSSK